MIELRQLRHILLLKEYKSFSNAARAANISQPSFSISIKKSEEILGVTLFNRTTNSVQITTEGKIIVDIASKMLETYSEGINSILKLKSPEHGVVKFGIDSFLARSIVDAFIPQMNTKYPNIRFEVKINSWYELIEALKRNEIDFLIVVYSRYEDFPSEVFDMEEMYVPQAGYFSRIDHPLAKMAKFDSRLLNNYQWVGNVVSPTWARWAIKVTDVEEHQLENMFLAKVNDYDKAIDLVKNNDAVGGHVLSELKTHEDNNKIKILDINWIIPHPKNVGIILSLKNVSKKESSKIFIKELQNYSQRWKM